MAGSVTGQETDAVRAEGLRHRGQRARSCAGAWLALAVLSAFGCEAITGLPDAKAPRAPGAPPDCSDVALVEDFEDNDDQIVLEAGRDGFVYTYLDGLRPETVREWLAVRRKRKEERLTGLGEVAGE